MSKFISLNAKYENIGKELVGLLMGLAYHCRKIKTNHPELFGEEEINHSHQFEFYSNEEYVCHNIYDGKVVLRLNYKDPYDDICDSESNLSFPIEWVDLWIDDKIEELNLLVSDMIKKYDKEAVRKYQLELLRKCTQAKLFTKEEYDKKFKEISS